MADVQVQQTPNGGGGASGAVWAIIALVVVAVVVFFVVSERDGGDRTDIDIEMPQAEAPKVDVPDKIEVDVPENVDVDVETTDRKPNP